MGVVESCGYDHIKSKGLPVFRDTDQLDPTLKFGGIVLIDLLEHVHEPLSFVRDLRKKLADGGWMFTATPNASGLNARIFRSRWREARKPGHLCLFTPSSVETFFRNAGIIHYRRLRWFIKYERGLLPNLLVAALTQIGLDGELRYLAFK